MFGNEAFGFDCTAVDRPATERQRLKNNLLHLRSVEGAEISKPRQSSRASVISLGKGIIGLDRFRKQNSFWIISDQLSSCRARVQHENTYTHPVEPS